MAGAGIEGCAESRLHTRSELLKSGNRASLPHHRRFTICRPRRDSSLLLWNDSHPVPT